MRVQNPGFFYESSTGEINSYQTQFSKEYDISQ